MWTIVFIKQINSFIFFAILKNKETNRRVIKLITTDTYPNVFDALIEIKICALIGKRKTNLLKKAQRNINTDRLFEEKRTSVLYGYKTSTGFKQPKHSLLYKIIVKPAKNI